MDSLNLFFLGVATGKSFIQFKNEDLECYKNAWAKWQGLVPKLSDRVKHELKDTLNRVQPSMDKPFNTFTYALSADFTAMAVKSFTVAELKLSKAKVTTVDIKAMASEFKALTENTMPASAPQKASYLQTLSTSGNANAVFEWMSSCRAFILKFTGAATLMVSADFDFSNDALHEWLRSGSTGLQTVLAGLQETHGQRFRVASDKCNAAVANFLRQKASDVLFGARGKLHAFGATANKFGTINSADLTQLVDFVKGIDVKPTNDQCKIASDFVIHCRPHLPSYDVQVVVDGERVTVNSDTILSMPVVAVFSYAARRVESSLPSLRSEVKDDAALPLDIKSEILAALTKCTQELDDLYSKLVEAEEFACEWQRIKGTIMAFPFTGIMKACATWFEEILRKASVIVTDFFSKLDADLKAQLSEMASAEGNVEGLLQQLDATCCTVTASHHDKMSKYLNTATAKGLYNSFRWASETTVGLRSAADKLGIKINFDMCETFVRAGATAASLTLLQAYWRPLKQGEDRVALIRRVVRALDPKVRGVLMRAHTSVTACQDNLKDVLLDTSELGCSAKVGATTAKEDASAPAESASPASKKAKKG